MRFQANGLYEASLGDVDPSTNPVGILGDHVFRFKGDESEYKYSLLLTLIAGQEETPETVTLDLFMLVESTDELHKDVASLQAPTTRWIKFATGVVVTDGLMTTVVDDLPPGGIIYGQMTADTLNVGTFRRVLAAWVC